MKKLNEILKNIEEYKNENPHYRELFEMLGEILILREEFRRQLKKDIFGIDPAHVGSKLSGGLPLIDFSEGTIRLVGAQEIFSRPAEDSRALSPRRDPGGPQGNGRRRGELTKPCSVILSLPFCRKPKRNRREDLMQGQMTTGPTRTPGDST